MRRTNDRTSIQISRLIVIVIVIGARFGTARDLVQYPTLILHPAVIPLVYFPGPVFAVLVGLTVRPQPKISPLGLMQGCIFVCCSVNYGMEIVRSTLPDSIRIMIALLWVAPAWLTLWMLTGPRGRWSEAKPIDPRVQMVWWIYSASAITMFLTAIGSWSSTVRSAVINMFTI